VTRNHAPCPRFLPPDISEASPYRLTGQWSAADGPNRLRAHDDTEIAVDTQILDRSIE
jgi:hypothetical protein